jgi:hypothetical protein
MNALPDWRYTRHDDILYFSHDKSLPAAELKQAVGNALMVIRESGYRPSWKRTQVQGSRRPQRLHGISINRKLNIPAAKFRRMHMLLYKAKQHGFEAQLRWAKKPTVAALQAWIEGWLNFYSRVAPDKTVKLQRLYAEAKQGPESVGHCGVDGDVHAVEVGAT